MTSATARARKAMLAAGIHAVAGDKSALENPRGTAIDELIAVLVAARECGHDIDRAIYMLAHSATVYAKTCKEMVDANLDMARDAIVDAAALSVVISLQNARAEAMEKTAK